MTGDRAELVKLLGEVREFLANDLARFTAAQQDKIDKVRAMLEADARREAALAGAIREIEAKERSVSKAGVAHGLQLALAILAKVNAEGVSEGAN